MVYNYKKDYKHIFDTPAKMEQESVVVNKIMELLNINKYDNIYDFINKNQTYQDFLKNHELENVVRHFGNTLSEQDFKDIQSEMVRVTERKKSFEKDDIKTTHIDDKEYVSQQGQEKTFFLDNSGSNMSIERQMEELQGTEEKFQTTDAKQNTENMMRELEENKKESLNLQYIKDINVDSLNDRQREVLRVAANYQLNMANPIRVDLDRELIVDKFDNIMRIEQNDGEFTIVGDDNQKKDTIEKEEIKEPKTFQKTLTPSPNTIYSENN